MSTATCVQLDLYEIAEMPFNSDDFDWGNAAKMRADEAAKAEKRMEDLHRAWRIELLMFYLGDGHKRRSFRDTFEWAKAKFLLPKKYAEILLNWARLEHAMSAPGGDMVDIPDRLIQVVRQLNYELQVELYTAAVEEFGEALTEAQFRKFVRDYQGEDDLIETDETVAIDPAEQVEKTIRWYDAWAIKCKKRHDLLGPRKAEADYRLAEYMEVVHAVGATLQFQGAA